MTWTSPKLCNTRRTAKSLNVATYLWRKTISTLTSSLSLCRKSLRKLDTLSSVMWPQTTMCLGNRAQDNDESGLENAIKTTQIIFVFRVDSTTLSYKNIIWIWNWFFSDFIYESVNLYSHHDWMVDILDGTKRTGFRCCICAMEREGRGEDVAGGGQRLKWIWSVGLDRSRQEIIIISV